MLFTHLYIADPQGYVIWFKRQSLNGIYMVPVACHVPVVIMPVISLVVMRMVIRMVVGRVRTDNDTELTFIMGMVKMNERMDLSKIGYLQNNPQNEQIILFY